MYDNNINWISVVVLYEDIEQKYIIVFGFLLNITSLLGDAFKDDYGIRELILLL